MGGVMQGAGFVTAAGSYVTQQTSIVADAQKYIAGARLYIDILRRTIDGFAPRFLSEVERDARNVERMEQLLHELLHASKQNRDAKSVAIVFQALVGYLKGLTEKYA
jgi:hypothetical protein